jgi:hypothetical protein
MNVKVGVDQCRGESIDILRQVPEPPRIRIGYDISSCPAYHSCTVPNSPYIPLGATTVSSPKICFAVPAISLNASVSPGVIGAGSSGCASPIERVMWCADFLPLWGSVKGEMVKSSFLAKGTRTSVRCLRVALMEEVLLVSPGSGRRR